MFDKIEVRNKNNSSIGFHFSDKREFFNNKLKQNTRYFLDLLLNSTDRLSLSIERCFNSTPNKNSLIQLINSMKSIFLEFNNYEFSISSKC